LVNAPPLTGHADRSVRFWLAGIILIGAILRYPVVGYGLPYLFHPDEVSLVHETYKFWFSVLGLNFSLSTNIFSHLLGFVHALQYAVCRVAGPCASLADFQRLVLLDDPSLYLSGRLMAATIDLGNIFLTYQLGAVLFGTVAGLVGAAAYAISAVPIVGATWVKMDSTATLFTLLAQIGILQAMKRQLPGGWYSAGFLAALAFATRISAAPIVVSLLAAYTLAARATVSETGDRRRIWTVLAGMMGTFVVSYLLLSFRLTELISGLLGEERLFWTQPYVEVIASKAVTVWTGGQWRTPGMIIADNAGFYARILLETVGWLGVAGIVAGLAFVIVRGDRAAKLSLIFPGLYLIPVLLFPAHASYYILLPLPFLFCYLGFLIQSIQDIRIMTPAVRRVGFAALAVVLLWGPVQVSAAYVGYMLKDTDQDTRVRAKAWIESHVSSGQTLAIEKSHELPTLVPPVAEDPGESREKLQATRELGLGSGKAREERLRESPIRFYRIVNITMGPVFGPYGQPFENQYDFDLLRRQGVQYVITGDYIPDSYVPGNIYPQFLKVREAFLGHLADEGDLVVNFVPETGERTEKLMRLLSWYMVDPPLHIYRLSAEDNTGGLKTAERRLDHQRIVPERARE
jgi:hypothetical protein